MNLGVDELLTKLCGAYQALMAAGHAAGTASSMSSAEPSPPEWFDTFYGLRDFMHCMKLLSRLTKQSTVSLENVQHALERNFNGREGADVQRLVAFWLGALDRAAKPHPFSNPFDLLVQSLNEQESREPISRYVLLIETTNDDSILRLLRTSRDLDLVAGGRRCTVLKLSDFSDDSTLQQANVISRAKYAANKGELIVLSQTERINESFYDLFNQHFQRMVDRDKDGQPVVTHHANIAIGSHSKLCQVSPGFGCFVHLRVSELREAPAPFLNRFEKCRLSHAVLLQSHLRQRPEGLSKLVPKVLGKVCELADRIGMHSFYGAKRDQTIESGIYALLMESMPPSLDLRRWPAVAEIDKALRQPAFVKAVDEELHGDPEAQLYLTQLASEPRAVAQVLEQAMALLANGSVALHAAGRAGAALLGQWMLHAVVQQLIQVVTPEQLYRHRTRLPSEMLKAYLAEQEHFSLKRLLRSLIEEGGCLKQLIWTRTSAAVLALTELGAGTELAADRSLEMLVCEPFQLPDGAHVGIANFAVCQLAQVMTQEALTSALDAFFHDAQRRVFLLVVDARPSECPTSRVNFARLKVNEMLEEHHGPSKACVLLLHCPARDITSSEAFYDTTFGDA